MPNTSYIQRSVEDDEAYVISEQKNVASGGTFNIHVRNPTSTNVVLLFHEIRVTTKGAATVNVYDDFDSITDGTDIVVQNANMDSGNGAPDEGPMDVYQDSTFTAPSDAQHVGAVIGSGGGGANSLGGSGGFPISRMESNRELVVEATNDANEAKDMVITILLTE